LKFEETSISKITKAKWNGGVVDHLFCKHKALSSNPSPSKKKNYFCGELRGSWFKASLGEAVSETPISTNMQAWWFTP
jgi:hypothetical protein